MEGSFPFTILALAVPAAQTERSSLPPEQQITESRSTSPNASPAAVAVRWFHFTALIALIGAVVFRMVVLARSGIHVGVERLLRIADERSVQWIRVLAVASTASLFARLWAQSVALHGAETAFDPDRISTMLALTRWGHAWLLQLAGTIVLVPGVLVLRKHAARRTGWLLIAAAALLLSIVPALSGHAAGKLPLVVVDTAHVIAAGAWIGTLIALAVCGIPATRALDKGKRIPALAALVTNFSRVALVAVAALIASGSYSAFVHLRSPADMVNTVYGRTLATKLGILLLVLGTGFYNWRFVQPHLTTESTASRFRTSAAMEIAIAVAILLVTAILVALPLPARTP